MMKKYGMVVSAVCALLLFGCGQEKAPEPQKKPEQPAAAPTALLIDDFEGPITGGFDGTVDYGTGNGAELEVSASTDIKKSGKQSLQITYNAVPESYMWIARGFNLDANNAQWLVRPPEIFWKKYNAFSFYVYGTGSGAQIAFDIKDSGDEMWRYLFKDDTAGWKRVVVKYTDFFSRGDWQPDTADQNYDIDVPVMSFQFEPRPVAKGVIYIDKMELVKE